MNILTLAAIMAPRASAPQLTESRPPASAFTAILTLAAPRERVFAELADVENLPRWAGGLFERVHLVRGRWAALTALGELFLAVDANERTGEITLWAGWDEAHLHALPMQIAEGPGQAGEGGTCVRFAVPRVADESHARLCRALCDEWPGLFVRLDKIGVLGAGWRSN